MSESSDQGTILAMLQRMKEFRLPRALELKQRVDAGDRLTDADLDFLKRVFHDANSARDLVSRHPEYQELVSKMAGLYNEITARALARRGAT